MDTRVTFIGSFRIGHHPDADSFDQHLSAAASQIRAGTEIVEVTGIRILGAPHAATADALRASGVPVEVAGLVDGFAR